MNDPQDPPEDKRFSGSICLNVYIDIEDVTGANAKAVADEALEALKHDLRNLPQYSMIELETHDLWQINRRPGFWDKVDQAYDHAKDNTT
jgi:hypothetical protein